MLAGRASWDDVDAALEGERDFLREFVSFQGVQTNEVQRSWMLLPCFLAAAERAGASTVDVVELGPSAGLNLVWDRHGYRYREGPWGAGPLVLSGEERRPVPARLLGRELRVLSRVGIDRAPVDVANEHGARLLACFVWPDQTWRLEQLRRAIESVRADPPPILRGHVAELLPEVLARRGDADLTLVFATSVLGYLSVRSRERVREALREAARLGPVAFVTTSRPDDGDETRYALRVDGEVVEYADFHGAWIDHLG